MFELHTFLNHYFWGNFVFEYLKSLAIFLSVFVILKILKIIIINRLHKIFQKTSSKLDDLVVGILSSIGWPFYMILALAAAFYSLNLSENFSRIFSGTVLIIISFYITIAAQKVFVFFVGQLKAKDKLDSSTENLISQFGKWILWLAAVLIILQNLGFNITAVMAGLGVGGVAVAFALQSVLTDIFAYFSIHLDKPFEVGDFIIIGDDLGSIERIGLKSTRIRMLWGEELIVSNKDLTESRVHNYKQMKERRIHFKFSVAYETPSEKVKKIPEIVKNIFSGLEATRLDRVHFKEFGDSGLIFEVAYYTLTPDYNKYMDIQQTINLSIKEILGREKIDFAYPTQKIFLSKN